MNTAKATGKFLRPEGGETLPVFISKPVRPDDPRVLLEDGMTCYVWRDQETGKDILCMELVALNYSEKPIKTLKAYRDSPRYLTAPVRELGRDGIVAVVEPKKNTVRGYLEQNENFQEGVFYLWNVRLSCYVDANGSPTKRWKEAEKFTNPADAERKRNRQTQTVKKAV